MKTNSHRSIPGGRWDCRTSPLHQNTSVIEARVDSYVFFFLSLLWMYSTYLFKVSLPTIYVDFAHIQYLIVVFLDHNMSHMYGQISLLSVISQSFGPKWVIWLVCISKFLFSLFIGVWLLGGLEYTHFKLQSISRSQFWPDLTFVIFYSFLGPLWRTCRVPFLKIYIIHFFGFFLVFRWVKIAKMVKLRSILQSQFWSDLIFFFFNYFLGPLWMPWWVSFLKFYITHF